MCVDFVRRWFTLPGGAERAKTAELQKQQLQLQAAAQADPEDSESARSAGERRLRAAANAKGFSKSFFAPKGGGPQNVGAKMLLGA